MGRLVIFEQKQCVYRFASYTILVSAIDLTRACCANDRYLKWLEKYEPKLSGSLGIARYLAAAAVALEEEAEVDRCDAFDARDTLADLLMSSPPFPEEHLPLLVRRAIEECIEFGENAGTALLGSATAVPSQTTQKDKSRC